MSDDAQEQEAQKQERLFTQEEVNTLVGRTRAESAERAKRQMEAELQQQVTQQQAQLQQPEPPPQPQAGQQSVDIDAIQQQIMERMNQQRMEEEQKQQQDALRQQVELAAQKYMDQMAKGKEKYADFEEITSKYKADDLPELSFLISGLDNGADVAYELYKNDDKLLMMASMAKDYPKIAEKRLKSLSESINRNQSALQQAEQNQIPAPLDRMQPSQVSGSSDQLSVRDLRKQDWLKG